MLAWAGWTRATGDEVDSWLMLFASLVAFLFSMANKVWSGVLMVAILMLFTFFVDSIDDYLILADPFAYLSLVVPVLLFCKWNDIKNWPTILICLYSTVMLITSAIIKVADGNVNGWALFAASVFSFFLAIKDLYLHHKEADVQKIHIIGFIAVLISYGLLVIGLLTFSKQALDKFGEIFLSWADMFAYFSAAIPIYILAATDMNKWSKTE